LQIISPPQSIFGERLQRNASAASRVDDMLEQIGKKIEKKLCEPPTFLLCVLPDKNSDIYGCYTSFLIFECTSLSMSPLQDKIIMPYVNPNCCESYQGHGSENALWNMVL